MPTFNLPGRNPRPAPTEEKPKTVLEQRRDELRTRFTEMQWDLGGAAYEMAARDYFRLDVLAKMAARLQVVDAELAEIERITRLQEAGAAGACAGCGSLHARGAIYCWRCGRNVAQPQGSAMVLPAGTTTPPPMNGNGSANGAGGETAAGAAPVFSDTSVIEHDHRPGTPHPKPQPDSMAAHLPSEPPVHGEEPRPADGLANGNGSSHFFEPHHRNPAADHAGPDPASFEVREPGPQALPEEAAAADPEPPENQALPENQTPLEDQTIPEDQARFEEPRPDGPDLPGDQPPR